MSPDPAKKSDDSEAAKKKSARNPGAPDPGRIVPQFLAAPPGPEKTAAAWRLMRRLLDGCREDIEVTRLAFEYLEQQAPERVENLLGGLESALRKSGAEAGKEAEEAELLDLALEAASREAAGESPPPEVLERIQASARASELLEMMRGLNRPDKQARVIPLLVQKEDDGWVIYTPPDEAEQRCAALEEPARAGRHLGPWVLGEIAEEQAAPAHKIQRIPLSLDLPAYDAHIQLQVRRDYAAEQRQETWVYEVNLAAARPQEWQVGWGTQASLVSGWESLGMTPVETRLDPPTADPVWLYLRCRSGERWKESRQEIPMLKRK